MAKKFGVLFDMDGVLVNSNPVHKEAIRLFCTKHNIDVTEEFLKNRVYGRTNREWIPEVFGDITLEQCDRLADEKETLFRKMFNPKSAVLPGLHEFLGRLKQQEIKSVVATSAPKENADFILSGLSIRHYFYSVLDSSHVSKGKPDPEIYLKAAKITGFSPNDCIVFEDSIAGVEAGVRAGSRVIGITSTHTPEEMNNCTLILENFTGLMPHDLERILG